MSYQKLQAERAITVTPSNTVNIAPPNNGVNNGCVLYVGTGGTLHVLTVGGDNVTLVGVQSGSFIPVQVLRVFTDSSASNIVALW